MVQIDKQLEADVFSFLFPVFSLLPSPRLLCTEATTPGSGRHTDRGQCWEPCDSPSQHHFVLSVPSGRSHNISIFPTRSLATAQLTSREYVLSHGCPFTQWCLRMLHGVLSPYCVFSYHSSGWNIDTCSRPRALAFQGKETEQYLMENRKMDTLNVGKFQASWR